MQKVRRHPFVLRRIGLRPLVSAWFQVLLTRLVAVLFIVQSPYSFTIGHRGVFSLARWSGQLRTEFHELRATLECLSTPISRCRIRGFHPLWRDFPDASAIGISARGIRNPGANPGLGCSDFARRYSRNRCLFLFLQVLRCFSSLGSLCTAYAFGGELLHRCNRVSPFGHSRINARLPASRDLSQATTSFVASRCQDIHHAPLVA